MKTLVILIAAGVAAATFFGQTALAGPYATALANDPLVNPDAPDAGIPGFVGPDGDGKCLDKGPNNYVNPLFRGWADGYAVYDPFDLAEIQGYMGGVFADPGKTLGPVTGNNSDIASLGDMNATDIADWQADPETYHGPGVLTLTFSDPISNGSGADFAVFENGFISEGGTGSAGQILAELGYVEVSTNGVDFARFPSVSLTPELVGAYGTSDPTDVYNLVGKHVNASGDSWGTPFDLQQLAGHPLVLGGTVDLEKINYIRIVDIPGCGAFQDQATSLIDPTTGQPYTSDHDVYDAWETWGSGGVDFEALGVIHYYGKTLDSGWNSVGDADMRAFIDADTTLTAPVAVGALQFNGGYRLDGAAVTLGPGNRGVSFSDPTATAVVASDLLGGDGLTISGFGTIVFEGAKSYTGETVVENATLKGAVAALSRDITNNGAVEFVADATEGFAHVVSGTGDVRISGNGGVLVLNAVQTYSGITEVQTGTLQSGIDGALPDATVVDVAGGAALDLNGHSDAIGGLSGAGQVALGGATLTLGNKGGALTGAIVENGNIVVAAETSTQTFSGTSSFVGTVTLQSGTLAVNSDAALGDASNAVHFSGGTLQIDGTDMHGTGRTLSVDSGGELKLKIADAANTFALGPGLSGNVAVGLYGAGTVTVSGVNTHTGGVKLVGGTLEISDESPLGSGTLTFGGGVLRITGTSLGSLSVPLSGSSYKIDVADAAHTYTVGTEFNGSGSLYKFGPGAMTVSSAAGRTGINYIYDGTLTIAATAGIGGNSYLYNGGKMVLQSGVVNGKYIYVRDQSELRMEGNASSTGRIYLYSLGALVLTDAAAVGGQLNLYGGTIHNASGNRTLTGNGSLSSPLMVRAAADTTLVMDGELSGTGGLTKDLEGTLVLGGVNGYSGDTVVTAGLLELGTTGQITASTIVNHAQFQIAGGTHALGVVQGEGAMTVLASAAVSATSITQGMLTIGGAPAGGFAAVPEPGTWSLLLLGLLAAACRYRSRIRASCSVKNRPPV
ncbi:MAG: autotransporter-associated beta strand repeat-containing protein [Pirellulales bacterium]|nr:autotransporter-associated beta strand repeat-containing protein [Pirellulales bacterium]